MFQPLANARASVTLPGSCDWALRVAQKQSTYATKRGH